MKSIQYRLSWWLTLLLLLSTSCQREALQRGEMPDTETTPDLTLAPNMVPGEAIVKLKDSANRSSESELRSLLGNQLRSLTDEVKLEPIFTIGGAYEALQREAGLDRWYKVSFDPSTDLSQALSELQKSSLVEVAHGNKYATQTAATYQSAPSLRAGGETYNQGYAKFTNPDPLLPYQWHYQNEGSSNDPFFLAGADINLFKAWEAETGKKEVIVAIIDSGIDGYHEDLQGSLWYNPEEPGTYGYNFVDNSSYITPGFHGTHVAGTIAARNNNGIGVSGIAGGDGTPESGVRLMSIQIFNRDDHQDWERASAPIEDIAKGFQWAVEHGATIANCSWGFDDQRYNNDYPVIKDAIQYFVDNAGVDPQTKEQKPNALMKGGVVIFASGNEGLKNDLVFPGCYDSVVAVAAFGADFQCTSYSNIGDWVDIMAPGGTLDAPTRLQGGILSTITSSFLYMNVPGTNLTGRDFQFPGNDKYSYQQGTSMATPHVTGIAALVISKFGKQGFTSEMLKERLLTATKTIDFRAKHDRKWRDWLGAGYIDAARALEEDKGEAPVMTEITLGEVGYQKASISWLPAKDADAIDQLAASYLLTLTSEGKEPITITVPNYEHKEGTAIEYTFEKLEDGTKYHLEIEAKDRWGHSSKKSADFTTKVNHAPAITNLPATLPVVLSKSLPFYNLTLEIKDEDGHQWSVKEAIEQAGVKATVKENSIELLFLVSDIELGEYTLPIVLEDELGKVSTTELTYKVVNYEPVKKIADFGTVSIGRYAEPMQVELSDKFESPSGLKLSYAAKTSDSTIATVRILPGTTKLEITPMKVGSTMVQIIVSDGTKEFTSGFTVKVVGSSEEAREAGGTFILYPVPTEGVLNIQTGTDTAMPREVIITTLRGELVHRQYIDRDKDGISHVNLKKLTPGVYRIHLGKTTRTIVKK